MTVDARMAHNVQMGSSAPELDRATFIEFVCLAKHGRDPLDPRGFTVSLHHQLAAYCARGADRNHEWIRVPASRLCDLTIGLMEDRPPAPHQPRPQS
jgi:hypothetical protein